MRASKTIYSRAVASILRDNDHGRPLGSRLVMLLAPDDEREENLDEWAAQNGFSIPGRQVA